MFRIGQKWSFAGIVILAAGLLAGPGRAQAAFTTGIIIDQTILMPVNDPNFQLDFRASLAGMNALTAGDSMTDGDSIVFENIPLFNSASFTSTGFGNNLFEVTTGLGLDDTTDVTFTYIGTLALTNMTASSISLGDFLINTDYNYTPNNIPSQLLQPFIYMTQTTSTVTGEKNFGSGLTPVPSPVPEPASLALLAIGLPAVLALARRQIRRPG